MLAVAVVSVSLATWGGRRAVEPLVGQVQEEVAGRVEEQVHGLLQEAHRANDVQRNLVLHGGLTLGDELSWRAVHRDLSRSTPHVSYFTVADEGGHWLGTQILAGPNFSRTVGKTYEVFELREDLSLGPLVERVDPYDTLQREWYAVPARTLQPRWTSVYVWAHPRVLSMTLSDPVLDGEGELVGMVASDLALGDLQRALEPIDVGPGGRVFVVEPDGLLVASSQPLEPYLVRDAVPERLAAADVSDSAIAGVAAAIRPHDGVEVDPTYVPERVVLPDRAFRVKARSIEDQGLRWIVVVALDEEDLLSDVWAAGWATAWAGMAFAGLALALGVWLARRVSQPLQQLSDEVQLVRDFKLDNAFDATSALAEIGALQTSLRTMQTGLVSFRRFVPADLVRRILALGEEARLGGEMREVSVLFSDLVGYSTLSERLEPDEVIRFMNRYFDAMQGAIDDHDGVVLELLGDAILVVFGAPDPVEDHPEKAARCALAMREALTALNRELDEALGHRIGVHTGEVVAGNIGGHSYMKYGIIGDVVNVAARLEQLNKELGTSVLISDEVLQAAPGLAGGARDLGEVMLKGRDQPQRVHELS